MENDFYQLKRYTMAASPSQWLDRKLLRKSRNGKSIRFSDKIEFKRISANDDDRQMLQLPMATDWADSVKLFVDWQPVKG